MDRTIIDLNDNWRFHYGDIPEAWYKGYDDSSWIKVFLPHDWSVKMPFEKKNSSGTGYLSGGIGWYRVRFSLPEVYRGCRVRVVFDGIYKNSRIWCNSIHLGKRPYGYTEISYDISDFIRFGETDNEISVRVCHTDLADSRWFTGSGIYRKARLILEEPVHTAFHGIIFRTEKADETAAEFAVDAEIVNETDREVQKCFFVKLKDSDQKEVFSQMLPVQIAAGEKTKVTVRGKLAGAHLWSCENPYLYRLVTGLQGKEPAESNRETAAGSLCREGFEKSDEDSETKKKSCETVSLQEELPVGIRTFYFDPDRGFFLNGKSQKLKGVCVHHDGGCLGAAMYRDVWFRRLSKLKAAGCNAIRCSHNPHMPELYDLCDELGFLMMDEAFDEWENPKNKWSTGHNVYPPKHDGYAEDFPEWSEKDLADLIRRDRNHPSIVLWSIGNEIDYPNDPYCHPLFESMTGNNDANKPAKERQYDPDKPDASRLPVIASRLAAIVRKNDATRPVTLAAAFPELSSKIGFLDPLDVVGYNYKEQFYEQDHKRFPDKPFLGSENSHSYRAWLAVREKEYISGQFLWTGIDYLGEARGWPVHGSAAGILNLAGFEKPGYFSRKAFWSQEPYTCLLTCRDDGDLREWKPLSDSWNYEDGEQVEVRCFTNQPAAALFLNGLLIGARKDLTESGCFCWSLPFAAGTLQAVCGEEEEVWNLTDLNQEGTVIAACLETAGPAVSLEAREWKPDTEEEEKLYSQKREICQIEVTLLDKEGRIAADDKEITVEVLGGTLLGIENGNLADLTPYPEKTRRTRDGRLIIYAKPEGEMSVRIRCPKTGEETSLPSCP